MIEIPVQLVRKFLRLFYRGKYKSATTPIPGPQEHPPPFEIADFRLLSIDSFE
jgi:hypothetical protein